MEIKGGVFRKKSEANRIGFKRVGREKQHISTGLLPLQQEREVLWLNDPTFLAPIDVHAVVVVADVLSAIPTYIQQDYTLAIAPFTIGAGRGAVVQNTAGTRICLLDRFKALRGLKPGHK